LSDIEPDLGLFLFSWGIGQGLHCTAGIAEEESIASLVLAGLEHTKFNHLFQNYAKRRGGLSLIHSFFFFFFSSFLNKASYAYAKTSREERLGPRGRDLASLAP